MAIDSAAKRQGALGVSSPLGVLPSPDGTVDDDDRYILNHLYQFAASTGATTGGSEGAMSVASRGRRMGRFAIRPPLRRVS